MHNKQVEASGNRFARALDASGVPVRATVAVLLGNTPEYLATYRGSTGSGRRLTPMSWRWSSEDVAYVVKNCEAAAMVVDARFAPAVAEASRAIPEAARFSVGGHIPGFRPWSDVEQESADPIPNPLCGDVMLYTSGTTGRPKGVRRPFLPDQPPPTIIGRAGMAMIETFLGAEHRKGTHLVSCPLYHVAPTTYSDGALLLGADVVLMERFDAEDLLRQIEKHRVVSTFLVPTQFVRMLRLPEEVRSRYDLSSLRLVMHGAAPVAVEIKRQMIEWLGPILFEFYGGTEGGGVMINSADWLKHPGSVGRPRPGLEVHILDDEGIPAATGEAGAVYFRGEDAPFEYKDDAEKTAEARRGEYYTLGDIGRLDEDGFLYLLDRRADIIISGGVNIYPAEIESVLFELPYVADCCVVGAPDDEWGEHVRAVIELDPTQPVDAETIGEEVIAHCRERLGGYQIPRGVDFAASLPRTETGKLARRVIREPYWAGRDRRI